MAKETARNKEVSLTSLALAAGLALALAAAPLTAQEPAGLAAAAAIENALVQTIATAEKSVVAIARVRKEQGGDSVRLEFRPDPFGRRLSIATPPQPTDPNFVPNEYGTGVVVDRRGLILTACHVLGDENDNYYITTSDRRVYRAWIKAADPRSDLAVLSIDGADVASANLVPDPPGRRRRACARGRSSSRWAIPMRSPATASPAPVGASFPTWAARPRRCPTRRMPAARRRCTTLAA